MMFKKSIACIFFVGITQLALSDNLNDALTRSHSQNLNGSTSIPTPQANVFTGDVKLACEAILCLSTGNRPNECRPSINRYFGIHHKHFKDTLTARKNFLNMCPTSQEPGMPSLVNAIVRGAGRCDAAELNRINRAIYTKRIWRSIGHNRGWQTIEVPYIRNHKPEYCSVYSDHNWTQLGTHYVGEEKNGGKWVD